MLKAKDILNDSGRKVITQLIKEQREKGIRASGKSAESLRHEIKDIPKGLQLTILGDESFEYQEYGRGPTRNRGGWNDPIGDIMEWMSFKPAFSGMGEKEKKGIAGAILYGPKGIHQTGTSLYKAIKGGDRSKALNITDIANAEVKFIRARLVTNRVESFKSEILRLWQA